MSVRIKPIDLTTCGLCARGSARWLKQHGLSWREFVSDGIPEEKLAGIADPRLPALLAAARRREAA